MGIWASIRQRQHMMRLFEVRRVNHLAVDLEHPDPGVGRKGIDDRLRARDLFGRGREGGIDRADLRRMDRHHPGKAVAPRAEIGRASCRERVCSVRVDPGGGRIITKKMYIQSAKLWTSYESIKI